MAQRYVPFDSLSQVADHADRRQRRGLCAGFVIPKLGVEKNNGRHSVTFSLGKLKAGTYRFNCAMGMVSGKLVVK